MTNDDIVERLRVDCECYDGDTCVHAAAVAEIERLQAAGDAMAELLQGYECLCRMSKCRCGHDAVLDAWKEARRG